MPPLEIERKWLMNGKPNLPVLEEYLIYQSYLYADENVEVRLVIKFDLATYKTSPRIIVRKLTIKVGNGLVRQENEITLTEEQCVKLSRGVKAKNIIKKFTIYDLGEGRRWEQSVVDPNEENSFSYGEVEFFSSEEAGQYELPPEVAALVDREVTGDPQYQMKNYWLRTRVNK